MDYAANYGHTDPAPAIARLNDTLRTSLSAACGSVLITRGLANYGPALVAQVLEAVRTFNDFSPSNDPQGEHDFGKVVVGALEVFWKIDYYDLERESCSPDPADPAVTARVLTILLAEEY